MKIAERKHLSMQGLLGVVGKEIDIQAKHFPTLPHSSISIKDFVMSALAVFNFKWPSLLQYDEKRHDTNVSKNLTTLYGVKQAPSDTYMRERLDEVNPKYLRGIFKRIFAVVQRGNLLDDYRWIDSHYLLSIDGTGHISSKTVHCKNCCEKQHHNGDIEYYYQLLAAVLVHPEKKIVIPLAPEGIFKEDGQSKNDCERNAAKRLLEATRCEHPHLKLIVVEDGLSSNGPHINLLRRLGMKFILGAKPSNHKALFDWVMHSKYQELQIAGQDGITHKFRFINGAPLNETHFDCEINFLEYWEINKDKEQQHFSWVTDIHLDSSTVMKVVRGGRARWRIENETFNTLKNQGYNFGHNYGHGHTYLLTVLAMLMMAAFLIDQVQWLCSTSFQRARAKSKRWSTLWEDMRVVLRWVIVESWQQLFDCIIQPPEFKDINSS